MSTFKTPKAQHRDAIAKKHSMRATSRRIETTAEPADPMAEAFVLAEQLAAAEVRDLLLHSGASTTREDHIAAVYDAVCAHRPDDDGDPCVAAQDLITQHVSDQSLACTLDDLITSTMVGGMDAGYLYGLAVGLAIGKGGAR